MKRNTKQSILRIVGMVLVLMNAPAVILVLFMLNTDAERWITLMMASIFAFITLLGLWMVYLSKRSPRVVEVKSSQVEEKSNVGENITQGSQEANATLEREKEKQPSDNDEAFSSYEELSLHERRFTVKRDQIDLLRCPELDQFAVPYDHKIAAAIALALQACGYEMEHLAIGGGSTEVSHTGAVEYGGSYSSLQSFLDEAAENYEEADRNASKQYGSWYTGLNWFWIAFNCARKGSVVQGKIDCVATVELTWKSQDWSRFDQELKAVKRYLCGGES